MLLQEVLWLIIFILATFFCECMYLPCHKINTSYLCLSIRFMLAAAI